MNLSRRCSLPLRDRRSPVKPNEPKVQTRHHAGAGADDQMLLDASRKSGYMNPVVATSTENKVRRMVRRLNLSGRDVLVWMGMLRQILWKLGNSK